MAFPTKKYIDITGLNEFLIKVIELIGNATDQKLTSIAYSTSGKKFTQTSAQSGTVDVVSIDALRADIDEAIATGTTGAKKGLISADSQKKLDTLNLASASVNNGTLTLTPYSGEAIIYNPAASAYSGEKGITISNDNKIGHSNVVTAGTAGSTSATSGTEITIPYITYDAQGHITVAGTKVHTVPTMGASGTTAAAGLVPKPGTTAGTTKYLREDGIWAVPPNDNDDTTYSAGTGLSLSGTTFNHSSNVTAGSDVGGSSATSGIEVTIPYLSYNNTGHITGTGTRVHTISTMGASGSTAAAGLVPKPSTTAGTTKYLREDGTWVIPPNDDTTYSAGSGLTLSGTTFNHSASITASSNLGGGTDTSGIEITIPTISYNNTGHITEGGTRIHTVSVMGASGTNAAAGLVPKPSTTAGTTKYLREDGTWVTPPNDNTTYSAGTGLSLSGTTINHSTSITAGSDVGGSIATSGTDITIPYLSYNNTGHITETGTRTHSIPGMTGATSSADGATGLVPKPVSGDRLKYLRGDGTWVTPPNDNTTYSAGSGLSLSGTTFNHSNVVTAATSALGGSSNTSGTSITIPYFTYDGQGHITAASTRVHSVPSYSAGSGISISNAGVITADLATSFKQYTGAGSNSTTLRNDITAGWMYLEVFINGLKLTPNEYSTSDSGGVTTVTSLVGSVASTSTINIIAHYTAGADGQAVTQITVENPNSTGYVYSNVTAASSGSVYDILKTTGTFAGNKTFSGTVTMSSTASIAGVTTITNNTAVTSASATSGALKVTGGIVSSSGIVGNQVFNAVWNDLADCIEVNDEAELEFGYCYCFDGIHYYKSRSYLDDGIIGIHSDTAGMIMGGKGKNKELQVAVAGFVLAYVDKEYTPGTPLTCTVDGYLTEITKQDKIANPEKIIATYWKPETAKKWGSKTKKILVNNRHWVKIK